MEDPCGAKFIGAGWSLPAALSLSPAANHVASDVAQCPLWLKAAGDCGEPAGTVKVRVTERRLHPSCLLGVLHPLRRGGCHFPELLDQNLIIPGAMSLSSGIPVTWH